MNNNRIHKQEIIENAELLFIKVGFISFDILDLSKKLNIDYNLIRTYFVSKGGVLLSILSVLFFEFFNLNNSFSDVNCSLKDKKEIFSKVMMTHERKIKLFVALIEWKELRYIDSYLRKLLSRTISLHYRLFLLQVNFEDSGGAISRRSKNSYYHLFDRFKTKETEAFQESC